MIAMFNCSNPRKDMSLVLLESQYLICAHIRRG